jgi:hypothetical protein
LRAHRSSCRLLTTSIDLTQSLTLLPTLVGRVHKALCSLHLGRVDQLEGLLGGILLFRGILFDMAAIPVRRSRETISGSTSIVSATVGKVRRTSETVGPSKGGVGQGGKFGDIARRVGVRLVNRRRSPRVGSRGDEGNLKGNSHLVSLNSRMIPPLSEISAGLLAFVDCLFRGTL